MWNNKRSVMLTPVLMVAVVFILTSVFLPTAFSNPDKNEPVQLEADSITYGAKQDIIEAEGNVTITKGNSVITALYAKYNTKTNEGYMTGNVKAVMENITLTADEITSYDNNERISAVGNVVAVKGADRLTGPSLDYYPARQYALMSASARIETEDAVMTADELEVFFDEEKAIGTGNVHIVSDTRKIDATANQAHYLGLPKENGKIILTGNARVMDEGNLLTGENLTISLNEKMVDARGGRPRLVVIPNKKGGDN